ncbi:MAG: mandelate racemase/muconate lactonizing enzyme family protein [Pirellulales bacterium]
MPVQIHELELFAVEVPRTESQRPVRSVLIRVGSESGAEGWGEAPLPWRVDELPGRRDAIMAALEGHSMFDLEELHRTPALCPAPLRAGVELALWDVVGRVCGQPLCHLLGGGFRGHVPIALRIDSQQPEQVARLADEASQQGFLAVVLHLTGDPARDLTLARAARQAVGDRVELRLDAAERFRPEAARDFCAALEPSGVACLIDPLDTRQLHAAAALGRQTTIPLAVGRALGAPGDVLAAVRAGAGSMLVLNLEPLGGILPARKATTIAEAADVPVTLAIGGSVGLTSAAMLQLAAALPALAGANACTYAQLTDSILADPPELIDGMLSVPPGSGLGVQVDRAKLEQYQVG